MAHGTTFEGSNIDMGAPKGMEERVYSLPCKIGICKSITPDSIIHTDPVTISNWAFTEEECQAFIKEYNETGTMTTRLLVWGGMPPTRISNLESEFDDFTPYTDDEIRAMQEQLKERNGNLS